MESDVVIGKPGLIPNPNSQGNKALRRNGCKTFPLEDLVDRSGGQAHVTFGPQDILPALEGFYSAGIDTSFGYI